MSEVDDAVNALAGEIVAHPATSRWFLSLSNEDCAYAVDKLKAKGGFKETALVVEQKTLLKRHCGRRMAIVSESSCKCGHVVSSYFYYVCLCRHCGYTRLHE